MTPKLRCWNKIHKEFATEFSIRYYSDGSYGIDFAKGNRWELYTDADEDCELTQYTGSKDENEKEIYVGDIVNTHVGKSIVILFKNPLQIRIKRINDNVVFGLEKPDTKIIGNIYENPELLIK